MTHSSENTGTFQTLMIVPEKSQGQVLDQLPNIVERSEPKAIKHFLEFFAVTIDNDNTRSAYVRAIRAFLNWLEENTDTQTLPKIEPIQVAAYIKHKEKSSSIASTKQSLAAIRNLCDWLVVNHVMQYNPAASVKGPKRSLVRGKTLPVESEGMIALFEAIKIEKLIDYRDRALIGVMTFATARVSAALGLNLNDLYEREYNLCLRLREKGGKEHEVPAKQILSTYIDEYRHAAQLTGNDNTPLFQSIPGRTNRLSGKRMSRNNALDMVKRRAAAAGLDPQKVSNHSFRATGITTLLKKGGSIVDAQRLAGHADMSTTRLYDHTADEVTRAMVERIEFD